MVEKIESPNENSFLMPKPGQHWRHVRTREVYEIIRIIGRNVVAYQPLLNPVTEYTLGVIAFNEHFEIIPTIQAPKPEPPKEEDVWPTEAQKKWDEFTTHGKATAEQLKDGVKLDTGKARFDLVAPEMVFAVAIVATFGATKYAERNWEKGMKWGRVFAACMRHLWAWQGGKLPTNMNYLLGELDTETQMSHLWHAGWCIMALIAYEQRGVGTDDRMGRPDQLA